MKNKIYKILLIFVLMFSICIVNAEENAYGYIPEEYNHYYKIDTTKNNIVRNRGVYSFYSAIPSSYDLRDVNGKRLIPPMDNQGTAPFCWAFASNNVIESYYLKHNLGALDLSDNQPAYVAYYYGDAKNGFFSGNSAINALKYWFLGHSPVTENLFGPYSTQYKQKDYKDYLDNSNVEIDIQDVIVFPMLLTDYVIENYTVEQAKSIMSSYTSDIKRHIMNNGALFAGIYMYFYDEETNLVYNDGTTSMELEEVYKTAHAITIVGWDDNVEGVSIKGTPVKGAWIAMNSWGDNKEYFYISYYDRDVVDAIFGVSRLKTKEWNNSYINKKIVSNTPTKKIYEFKKNNVSEKIDSVKILYYDNDANISVSLSDGYNIYESITSSSTTFGIKTYEFDNVILDSEKIYVIVETNISTEKYNVALFTQNDMEDKLIQIKEESFNNSQSTFKSFDYNVLTENIISGTQLEITVFDDQGTNVTSYFTITKTPIINGYASLTLKVKTANSLEYAAYLEINVKADAVSEKVIQYNNGPGTQTDPYIIRHPYEMILLQENGYYFELGNDIDMYEDTNSMFGYFYNNAQGWNPSEFSSQLDGKGYSIKKLTTTKGSLFESMDNATIKNIKLDEFKISDLNSTTFIPGIITKTMNGESEISNVFINNSSISSKNNSVGGLVGTINNGKIENVHIKDTNIESNYYSAIAAARVENPTESTSILNVYSSNTSITGNKTGIIGIIDIRTIQENLKPIIFKNNLVYTTDEMNLIGQESIIVTDKENPNITLDKINSKIIDESNAFNADTFSEYDVEQIWSFDTVNSAYLKLFSKDFDNLLKLKTYLLQDNLIYKVKSETTSNDFISNIANINDLDYKIYSSSGLELTNESNVTTGSYIDVSNESKSKRYYIVVAGDANGDGTLSVFDIVKINNHIIDPTKKLEGMYNLAADYNQDGNLSIFDIVKINNEIIGGTN